MPTTLTRNGRDTAHPFPAQPLLLAPVILPFQGDYAGITIQFDVAAVRELLDADAAGLIALNADLAAQEAALDADPDLADAAREAQRDGLWRAGAERVIRRAVHRVEWAYDDPAPDPQAPETWPFDPHVLCWIGQVGLGLAGAQFAGPLVRRVARSRF